MCCAGHAQEQEQGGEQSRMRTLGSAELLRQLPVLQRLLGRLVDCRPTGAASLDPVVQVRCPLCCGASSLHSHLSSIMSYHHCYNLGTCWEPPETRWSFRQSIIVQNFVCVQEAVTNASLKLKQTADALYWLFELFMSRSSQACATQAGLCPGRNLDMGTGLKVMGL